MELERDEQRILDAALEMYEAHLRIMAGVFDRDRDDDRTVAFERELGRVKTLREKIWD
jgi:hypothetical protein